jgi:UDP-N-acetyl-2-amino-2-deoxyglucuronate dehydrogenase
VAICSPNYLHHAHIAAGLRLGCDVICEKPLVPTPELMDELARVEQETGKARVQHPATAPPRRHPQTARQSGRSPRQHQVRCGADLHHQPRQVVRRKLEGRPAQILWRGHQHRRALLRHAALHLWASCSQRGAPQRRGQGRRLPGIRTRPRALVFVDRRQRPARDVKGKKPTFRNIDISGEQLEFSEGFTDLHTTSYREILAGRGYGLADARHCIETVNVIRTAQPVAGSAGRSAPLCGQAAEFRANDGMPTPYTPAPSSTKAPKLAKAHACGTGCMCAAARALAKACRWAKTCLWATRWSLATTARCRTTSASTTTSRWKRACSAAPAWCSPTSTTRAALIERKNEYRNTLVKKGATLGANCTIVCGTTIGEYAFVGAGAVVNKDVPAYALMVGVPARQIGWMSEYGEQLSLPLQGQAEATCPHTSARYVLDGQQLHKEDNTALSAPHTQ